MTSEKNGFPLRKCGLDGSGSGLWNWAQNTLLADKNRVHKPATEQELQALIAGSKGKVRMIGNRMSSGRMLKLATDDDILVDLCNLNGMIAITENSATFAAGTSLQEVYDALSSRDRMLAASPGVIAVQTLAGALATGTHGQGLHQSSIADEVISLRMVLADGSIQVFERQHPLFPAVLLGLGCLGVVTQVTLRIQPLMVYTCFKNAVSADNLGHDLLAWNQDYALSKAWWFPNENQVHIWNARLADRQENHDYRENNNDLLKQENTSDAMNDTVDQTLSSMRSDTQILDDNGKPFRTVTRFKDFSDVTGDIYQVFCRGIATPQINVEIGIPLERTPAVIEEIRQWHSRTQPHMHYPIILRCTGPSKSWLSPAYQQETCFFGFVVYYA